MVLANNPLPKTQKCIPMLINNVWSISCLWLCLVSRVQTTLSGKKVHIIVHYPQPSVTDLSHETGT